MDSEGDAARNLTRSEALRVVETHPGFLSAAIANGPYNLFDPVVFAGLHLLQEYAEADDVRVIVFESANPLLYGAH